MKERPNCVCENRRTEWGTPDSAISSGIVTCFSTSSGARPGNRVITCTWMSETSGKASIGSASKAAMPAPTKSATSSITNSGWRSANATTRVIMEALRAEVILVDPLQQDGALAHHALSALEALQHRQPVAVLRAERHLAPFELAGCVCDVQEVAIALEQNGGRGDFGNRRRIRRLDVDRNEHLGAQDRLGILQRAARADGAAHRVEEVAHGL